MNFAKHSLILSIFLIFNQLYSQEILQNIRGKIVDEDTKVPLIGANVVILNSDPFKGAVTDIDGFFTIESVPLGRVDIKISYLGYEEKIMPNVLISSGKELVIKAELRESISQMQEVEIVAEENKGELNDEMAMISARSVSVEETKRYAGSFDDPARMVSAFAGVSSDPQGSNFIVVRGNSPRGILWRMEGVEVTNPNHFSDLGATGGGVSALNSAMLDNSDFFTGAFAPSYGNALSGIFDIKLREGNYSNNEYKVGIGTLGTDISLEGPFKKGKSATYLVNYRYSTLSLLNEAKLVDFDGVPEYQDLAYNIKLPTKKVGIFSFFGLLGLSGIEQEIYDEADSERLLEVADATMFTGNMGMKHVYLLSDKTFLESILNVSGQGNKRAEDDVDNNGNFFRDDDMDMRLYTPRASFTLNHKLNARHKVQIGMIYSMYTFDMYFNYYDDEAGVYVTQLDAKGNTSSMQSFVSWKFRVNERLTLVSGLHLMQFQLSNSTSFEPRVATEYRLGKSSFLNAGFGVHSRLEPITSYFSTDQNKLGTDVSVNNNLTATKARHYVLGYKNFLSPQLMLNIETYYQELYDVPVENDPNSSFSMINVSEWFPNRQFVNEGTGSNLGIEFTLERYFTRNYYFLFTTSLYESKYKALDGVQRNSRFNGNYLSNFLIGREFTLNKKENKLKLINASIKLSYAGGQYFTPIDLQASIAAGNEVAGGEAYSEKGEDIPQVNFSFSYRIERKKTSQVLKLDVLNITNNQAKLYPYYDADNQVIRHQTQLSIIPNIAYVIEF